MSQTKAELIKGLNINASAPATALQIDASGNVNIDSNTLYVDATNNRVGLGTSSPGAPFHVSGSGNLIRLGDATNTFDVRFTGPNNWDVQLDTSADKFNIRRNSSSLVTVDGAGRLGIGTTSPSSSLVVSNGGANGIEFGPINGDIFTYNRSTSAYTNTQITCNEFVVRTNGSNERARIDTSGRLLVGTSTAVGSTRLQVHNGVDTTFTNLPTNVVLVNTGAIAAGLGTGINFSANYDNTNTTSYAGISGIRENATSGSTAGALVFGTRDSAGSTSMERMRITSGGGLLLGYSSSSNVSTGVVSAAGYAHKQGLSGSPGSSSFNFFWTGSLQAWIDTSNVGNVTLTSDYRIKKNIETQTSPAIPRLKQLRPVTYERANYKTLFTEDGVVREGFIAHELAEIVPSAVEGEKDAENQIQSINIDALVSVLTKALQEAVEKIETLEAKVAALEAS